MNLIKQINQRSPIMEDAASGTTGAVAIATAPVPLLASMVKREISSTPRIIKFGKSKKKTLGLKHFFYVMKEDLDVDSTQIISKLKALENKESAGYKDISTFGFVDQEGHIIQVSVPTDQSDSFEHDIQTFLGHRDESKAPPDIGEVLFKLKDRYTIIDINWPSVEEDQEESQELANKDTKADADNTDKSQPPIEDELPNTSNGNMGDESTEQVGGLLSQVIDMMKADADARKAEAQAREAEAKTKQANAAKDQAIARVRQQEQILDMDEYNKNQKDQEKEAKRLAQLAKWKHDMTKGEQTPAAQKPQFDFVPNEEEEERLSNNPNHLLDVLKNRHKIQGKVNATDVARYILKRTHKY